MSIEQKLMPVMILSALFGLDGLLTVIRTSLNDTKVRTETLIALSSSLVTNAIYVYLLMYTNVFC